MGTRSPANSASVFSDIEINTVGNMSEEMPQSVSSSSSELAGNFSAIRVAHRSNFQQMEQLFDMLSKQSADYRELWKQEQIKNSASKAAILKIYEEGAYILLTNFYQFS